MSLASGTRLGSYEIGTVIGAEGMGEVYRAPDTRLERVVALKMLPARVARDPIVLERFHREARVIASVNHPHICAIYARQGRDDDCAHIETELADRRARGEYIPHACDVILATGRADVPGLRRALQGCIDEATTWLTVRMGPGPSLETFRRDPEVDRLLDTIYDVSD